MPGHDWTPDGKGGAVLAQAIIWKVDVATNAITRFLSPRVTSAPSIVVKPRLDATKADQFLPRAFICGPLCHLTSAAMVFGAIGRLWRKDMAGGAVTPLIQLVGDKGPAEIRAAWSPDGARLAFATAGDERKARGA